MSEPRRRIPAVSRLLTHDTIAPLADHFPQSMITNAIRAELEAMRNSAEIEIDLDALAGAIQRRVRDFAIPVLRTVINATGIVLHTNLGRSPMADSAALAAYESARNYLNLELDLDSGERSSRQNAIRAGVCELTGAESATVVNNCAAATVLTLKVLAAGREVIVSRGQLVEIGGGFRIPEILVASGAILCEVGTTNITRLGDYERAITPQTGMLLRVHSSNFRIRGFTDSVGIAELSTLGKKHGIPVIDDVGSGAAIGPFGDEPRIADGIAAGASLVLFSGDKLLGGPQSGIIAGRTDLIKRIEEDPLMRALRCDKMTLAALEATLRLHRKPEQIPTIAMLGMTREVLKTRAEQFAHRLKSLPDIGSVEVQEEPGFAGGGTMPDVPLPSVVIALTSRCHSAESLATHLRMGQIPALARIKSDRVLLDLRTVFDRQLDDLFAAVSTAASESLK